MLLQLALGDHLESCQGSRIKTQPGPGLCICGSRNPQDLDDPDRTGDSTEVGAQAARTEQAAATGAEAGLDRIEVFPAGGAGPKLGRISKPIDHALHEPHEPGARIARGVAACHERSGNEVEDLGIGMMGLQYPVGEFDDHRGARGTLGFAAIDLGDDLRLGEYEEFTSAPGEVHAADAEKIGEGGESAVRLAHPPGNDANLAVLTGEDGEDPVAISVVDAAQDNALVGEAPHQTARDQPPWPIDPGSPLPAPLRPSRSVRNGVGLAIRTALMLCRRMASTVIVTPPTRMVAPALGMSPKRS